PCGAYGSTAPALGLPGRLARSFRRVPRGRGPDHGRDRLPRESVRRSRGQPGPRDMRPSERDGALADMPRRSGLPRPDDERDRGSREVRGELASRTIRIRPVGRTDRAMEGGPVIIGLVLLYGGVLLLRGAIKDDNPLNPLITTFGGAPLASG